MKTISKFFILIILLLGLAACSKIDVYNSDNNQVKKTAAEIIDFDLPADYSPAFSFNLDALNIAAYDHKSGVGHLYLVQSANESDAARLDSFLNQQIPGANDGDNKTKVTENRQIFVRGQETTLVLSKNVNGDGISYRQAMFAFEGNSGPAMLVISMPEDSWDETTVEDLISSMH